MFPLDFNQIKNQFFIQRKKKIEFNFQHQILQNYQCWFLEKENWGQFLILTFKPCEETQNNILQLFFKKKSKIDNKKIIYNETKQQNNTSENEVPCENVLVLFCFDFDIHWNSHSQSHSTHGSTKTRNPESGNGNGITETETEYEIKYQW